MAGDIIYWRPLILSNSCNYVNVSEGRLRKLISIGRSVVAYLHVRLLAKYRPAQEKRLIGAGSGWLPRRDIFNAFLAGIESFWDPVLLFTKRQLSVSTDTAPKMLLNVLLDWFVADLLERKYVLCIKRESQTLSLYYIYITNSEKISYNTRVERRILENTNKLWIVWARLGRIPKQRIGSKC